MIKLLLRSSAIWWMDVKDLVKLAPRKPDWDLKRDVTKKLEKLERRTQRAIAELISMFSSVCLSLVYVCLSVRPVSRRISRRPKKNCGLAAVDVAKPPAKTKLRLSRRFCHRLSHDDNDVKVVIIQATALCRN